MLKKVTLLVNYNLYESKRYFTEKLVEAFHRHGIQTNVLDVHESALNASAYASIIRQQPQLTCSFNSILPVKKDRYLWDELEVPHLSFLVDPAIYSLDLAKSPYSIISCVDHFDCEIMKLNHAKNVFFWPHAVEKELYGDPKNDRPYDVVFIGSCYDIDALQIKWKEMYPRRISSLIEEAADITLAEMKTPFVEAFLRSVDKINLDISKFNVTEVLTFVDYFSRGRDRLELIRSLKNVKVHVFGDVQMGSQGWKEYLKDSPHVICHAPVSFSKALEILKKSKLCLNSMPFFKNGSHERIFTSLACGAVPITSANLFVKDQFKEGEELVTYDYGKWDEVNETIQGLLEDEKRRQSIATAGREIVMKKHTWDNRVEKLIEVLPKTLGKIYAQMANPN